MKPVYAAIFVPHLAAQAAVRMRPQLAATAVALMQGLRPHEHLYSATPAALALGLTVGMTRTEVESFPGVQILPRSLAEEEAAAAILLEAIGLFTPRAEVHPAQSPHHELLLDMTGNERLLGDCAAQGRKMLDHLAALHFTASIALCENPHAALSLARASAQPVTPVASGQLQQALAPLPVNVLNLAPEDQDRFAAWGIHTLGQLAQLAERDLITRLGQRGKRLRQLALGSLPHLLQPAEAALDLTEALDLDDPIETLEPLLFCLNPMLEQLLLRAQSRTLALAAITLTLTLHVPADRTLNDSPVLTPAPTFTRTIQPAIPAVDRALLLKMLQLDLESHPPPGAITHVHLSAEPGQTSRIQLGLFAPPMPEPTRFEDTYARLMAIVGKTNVGRLRPLDTHAAESFTLERFKLPAAATQLPPARSADAQPATAMRRLRPPAPIRVFFSRDNPRTIQTMHYESRRFRVLRCFGPWRSSGEWWQTGPSSSDRWSTDTWDLAAQAEASFQNEAEDELLLCIVAHDLLRDCWRLEAIYD